MNDPGKEAGSWLELALTARPHFSLAAMMRDAEMDLVWGEILPQTIELPIQTFQKTKARVKRESGT